MLCAYTLFSQSNPVIEPAQIIRKADSLLSSNPDRAIQLVRSVVNTRGLKTAQYLEAELILGIAFKNKGKYDSSLHFVSAAIEKALEVKDTNSLIKLRSNRGVVQYLRADYAAAVQEFKNAKQYYEARVAAMPEDTATYLDFARVLNNMASAYIKTGQTDSALHYFIQSLKIRQDYAAPKRMLTVSELNIGSIYLAIGENENAKVWLEKALGYATQAYDSGLMLKCHINLGITDKKLGDTLSAISNYRKSLMLSEQTGNQRDQAIALQNLAILLSSQKKYDEAHQYFVKALRSNHSNGINNSRLHLSISRMFLEQQQYDSAIVHAKQSLQLANESGNVNVQLEDYDLFASAYQGKKQFYPAFDFLKKYVSLKDTVTARENQHYIQEVKSKFELEIKENEIRFLKELNQSERAKAGAFQSRQRLIIVVVLLALILLIVIAVYYYSKKKKEKELYLIEKKLLETDLQNKELLSKELNLEINYKTRQLTTHALNMIQRNEILTELREKLEKFSKQIKDELASDLASIINNIRQIQRTEKDWELFKKYFENINKDFNKRLREINPSLSVHDYRLAALISLNLNIKEAAAVLNITPSSVKLARHRLRKKLHLKPGDDLYVVLNKL